MKHRHIWNTKNIIKRMNSGIHNEIHRRYSDVLAR